MPGDRKDGPKQEKKVFFEDESQVKRYISQALKGATEVEIDQTKRWKIIYNEGFTGKQNVVREYEANTSEEAQEKLLKEVPNAIVEKVMLQGVNISPMTYDGKGRPTSGVRLDKEKMEDWKATRKMENRFKEF